MARSTLDPAARYAVQWMVKLQSGDVSDDEQRAFEAWRMRDPSHAQAWAQLERTTSIIRAPREQGVSVQALHALIPAPPASVLDRRTLLRGVIGAGVLGAVATATDRVVPLAGLVADVSTATGERRSLALADGSRLVLNARSAVDRQFDDAGSRRVRVRSGLVYVDVAPGGTLPFELVASVDGEPVGVELSNGACMLFVDGPLCRIDVTRGQAGVRAAGSGTVHLGSQDSMAWRAGGALRRFTTPPSAALSWLEGRLTVVDEPLSEVVRMLQPYHVGLLRLEPAVAGLRVTGTYPLAEVWQALSGLASTLPIRITQRARYWITIGAAS